MHNNHTVIMNTDQRLKRLESVVSSLIDYINKYNINTVKRDYDCFLKREEASHRHKLSYDYTVGTLVWPNPPGPVSKKRTGWARNRWRCHLNIHSRRSCLTREKTHLVLKLIDNMHTIIKPAPSHIVYYFMEDQPIFGDYPEAELRHERNQRWSTYVIHWSFFLTTWWWNQILTCYLLSYLVAHIIWRGTRTLSNMNTSRVRTRA